MRANTVIVYLLFLLIGYTLVSCKSSQSTSVLRTDTVVGGEMPELPSNDSLQDKEPRKSEILSPPPAEISEPYGGAPVYMKVKKYINCWSHGCDTVEGFINTDGAFVEEFAEDSGYSLTYLKLDGEQYQIRDLPEPDASPAWSVYEDKGLSLKGYMTLAGEIMIPAQYRQANWFLNERAVVQLTIKEAQKLCDASLHPPDSLNPKMLATCGEHPDIWQSSFNFCTNELGYLKDSCQMQCYRCKECMKGLADGVDPKIECHDACWVLGRVLINTDNVPVSRFDYVAGDQYPALRFGRARVCRNGLYGYIDKEGNEVIAPKFYEASEFSNALANVKSAPLGYPSKEHINTDGELMTQALCLVSSKANVLYAQYCYNVGSHTISVYGEHGVIHDLRQDDEKPVGGKRWIYDPERKGWGLVDQHNAWLVDYRVYAKPSRSIHGISAVVIRDKANAVDSPLTSVAWFNDDGKILWPDDWTKGCVDTQATVQWSKDNCAPPPPRLNARDKRADCLGTRCWEYDEARDGYGLMDGNGNWLTEYRLYDRPEAHLGRAFIIQKTEPIGYSALWISPDGIISKGSGSDLGVPSEWGDPCFDSRGTVMWPEGSCKK